LFFHEMAQELKLHMDPTGRAGVFVKRLVRDSLRDPMTDEEQEAECLNEYNPMEKNISLNMLSRLLTFRYGTFFTAPFWHSGGKKLQGFSVDAKPLFSRSGGSRTPTEPLFHGK